MIKIEHFSYQYGSHRAVSDISFEIKKGEIEALIGPNGAGKSTTIRSMLGFLKFSEGSIEILDEVKCFYEL